MNEVLKSSNWPILRLISPEEMAETYDTIVLLCDNSELENESLKARAEELSIPLKGFADDGRIFRVGYSPRGGTVAFIGKISDPARRRKNPYIVSPQRSFMTILAEKIKSAGRTALIDCAWVNLEPQWFDAFLSVLYDFDCYKREFPHLTDIHVVKKNDEWNRELGELAASYRWIYFARDMVNHPPGAKSPEDVAALIKERVETLPNITASIIAGEAVKEFDLIWRVGKGSPKKPPALLRIEYAPPEETVNKKPLVLIGKGVLFDQGGVTAKTDDGDLATMKLDCSGAMDVAAVTAIAAELKLPLKIVAYMPFAVNMLSHEAGLPGDIGQLKDGTTVEISDTDAEGRLIVIDTVAHAVLADSPELVLTLATLSGNTEGALGELAAGVFTDTKSLWSMLEASAELMEEHVAKFPMVRKTFDDLKEKKDSAIPAELRNFCHGWPDGDPIRAACFVLFPALKKNILSVHIDICGPAFIRRPLLWFPEGATGWGIRMLSEFLKRFAKERAKTSSPASGGESA